MYDRLAAALVGLGAGAGHIAKRLDMGAVKPVKRSFHAPYAQKQILDALVQRANDMGVNSNVGVVQTGVTPENLAVINRFPQHLNASMKAGSIPGVDPSVPIAAINPNASRVWAAKALGGALGTQTKVGKVINDIYHNYVTNSSKHPMLSNALVASTLLAPIGVSALMPGDDDTDEAIALSALPMTAVPLAKEAYDTYQGQRLLNKSGLTTTMGQRAKMAGNLLSMLALPVIAGSTGNMIGNIMDKDIPPT